MSNYNLEKDIIKSLGIAYVNCIISSNGMNKKMLTFIEGRGKGVGEGPQGKGVQNLLSMP